MKRSASGHAGSADTTTPTGSIGGGGIGRAPQVGLATATNGGQENAATGGMRASDGGGRADGGDRAVSEGGARIDGGLETSSLADDCDLDFNYWASVGDQAGGASGPSGRRLVLGCPWGH